jgi:hypothetical protein
MPKDGGQRPVVRKESRFPGGTVPPSAEPVWDAVAGTETGTPPPPAAASFLDGYDLVDIEFMCLKALGEMG